MHLCTNNGLASGNPEGHVLFHWVDTMEEHPVNTQPKPECTKDGHASKNGLRS